MKLPELMALVRVGGVAGNVCTTLDHEVIGVFTPLSARTLKIYFLRQ